MTEKKPAVKKRTVKSRVLKVPLEKISEIRFIKDGEEYFLVPLRFGKFVLTHIPK